MRARCYIQAYCAIGKLKSTKKSALNNVDASRKLIDKKINIYLIVTNNSNTSNESILETDSFSKI